MMQKIDDKIKQEKLRKLNSAMKSINKKMGNDTAVQLLGQVVYDDNDRIPCGRLSLSTAAGGGILRGRIIELFGLESSGKSLVSYLMISAMQQMNGICAFIDAENHFIPSFAQKQGVDTDSLVYSVPDSAEDALETIKDLIASDAVDLIVLDSLAAMSSETENKKAAGEQVMGGIARLMSSELRKINRACAKHKVTLVIINQVRDNIGVMYGNPETTNGGKAVKFYSSYRARVSSSAGDKIYTDSSKTNCIGQHIKVKFVKNKTAPPFKVAEFTVYFDGRPFGEEEEVADIAVKYNIIPRYDSKGNISAKGRTYKWDSEPEFKATSQAAIATELKKFPNVLAELKELIMSGKFNNTEEAEEDLDANMSEEEFENSLRQSVSTSDAEEIEEGDWGE